MRALEIFDADERGKLAGTLHEVLTLSHPPAAELAWTLRYIETPDDVSRAWPKGLKDLEAAAGGRYAMLVARDADIDLEPAPSTA